MRRKLVQGKKWGITHVGIYAEVPREDQFYFIVNDECRHQKLSRLSKPLLLDTDFY
jgi:hypothetical protein